MNHDEQTDHLAMLMLAALFPGRNIVLVTVKQLDSVPQLGEATVMTNLNNVKSVIKLMEAGIKMAKKEVPS